MCALTMNDHVFVLLEDPAAPTRADVLAALQNTASQGDDGRMSPSIIHPSHYRTTFLTLRPPGGLEQLLSQLKARWIPVRQSSGSSSQRGQGSAQQLSVEGLVFAIGNDWLVRVGNVILAGGSVKGMLLEVGVTMPSRSSHLLASTIRLNISHSQSCTHRLQTVPRNCYLIYFYRFFRTYGMLKQSL
jgi:hypothetical protein